MPDSPRLPSMQALLCFDAVERLGSVTEAAGSLHLSQGAVSRQILGLESRLGVALFHRQPGGLVLTTAGRTYLADVRPALQRLERATTEVGTLRGRGGRLRLSVSSIFATHWLIPRLPRFTRAHPEVTIDLTTRIGPVDFVRADVDAAISFVDGIADGIEGVRLAGIALRPHAARVGGGSTLHRQLSQSTLLHLASLTEAWPRWAEAAIRDTALRQRLAAGHGPRYELMSMALNAAVAGLGVVLLPAFVAAPSVADGRLRCLSRRAWVPSRAYHLTCPQGNARLDAVVRLRDWLLQEIGDGRPLPLI